MLPVSAEVSAESAFTSADFEALIERLVGLLVDRVGEDIPKEDLPPGVDEPHRAEVLQCTVSELGDLEGRKHACDAGTHAGPDVGLEVIFENEARLDQETARRRVEEWLETPNPALAGSCPNQVLQGDDEMARKYLLDMIAGFECGVYS